MTLNDGALEGLHLVLTIPATGREGIGSTGDATCVGYVYGDHRARVMLSPVLNRYSCWRRCLSAETLVLADLTRGMFPVASMLPRHETRLPQVTQVFVSARSWQGTGLWMDAMIGAHGMRTIVDTPDSRYGSMLQRNAALIVVLDMLHYELAHPATTLEYAMADLIT